MTLGTILVAVYAFMLNHYSSSAFDSYYNTNWGDLMGYVNKASFTVEEMNCYGGKYYNNLNSTNFYDLKCKAKEEIAYMWEVDITK
jgi:hypothetical protein